MSNNFFVSIQETSVDIPDRLSYIIYVPNCNLNCEYCYNKVTLREKFKKIFISESLPYPVKLFNKCFANSNFIELKNYLQYNPLISGIVFSGGEITLYDTIMENMPKLKKEVKKINKDFKLCIQSNGVTSFWKNLTRNSKLIESVNNIDIFQIDLKLEYLDFLFNDYMEYYIENLYLLTKLHKQVEVRIIYHPFIEKENSVSQIQKFLHKVNSIGIKNIDFWIKPFDLNSFKILNNANLLLKEQYKYLEYPENEFKKNYKLFCSRVSEANFKNEIDIKIKNI